MRKNTTLSLSYDSIDYGQRWDAQRHIFTDSILKAVQKSTLDYNCNISIIAQNLGNFPSFANANF